MELGQSVISANETRMRRPGLISMKGAEHTWVVLLHELKKTDKCLLFLICTKAEIGADRENGLYTIDPLQIFRTDEGGGEGAACVR